MITNQEPDNNIQAVVADFKSKYDKTSEQTGFIQSMAQGMAKPFLTAAATGASAVKGITGAIGAGINALTGNKEAAKIGLQEAAKPVNINAGYFGTGEAIGGKGESTADVVKKSVGTGLELGSWMVGGSGAKSAITQSLKQKVGQGALQGLKTGAAAGSLTGTGVEMQKDDSTTGDIIGAGLGGGLIGGSVGAVAGGATPIIAKGARSIFPKSQARQLAIKMEKLDQTIDEGVSKGIKPTVIGKKTLANNDKFYSNARIAVKTIAENRSKINVFDDLGEKVSHPKSNAQAAQAIDQAKKIIYNEYHKMATDAGDMGAVFNDIPIINKLQKVSADLKFSPKVRQYAASMVDEISELKGQAPDVIEARIAELNESLKSYYAGTRIDKAKAQVDASVAKAMREQLDNIIEAAGDGYKELKMQYGALKSIENEVNKRALVLARQGGKSLIDFTDIFTGGDLVSGLLTGNPAVLARGIAGKGIAAAYKKINDPDRYIEKMFKEAYKVIPETSISTVPFASSAGMAGKNVNLAPKPVSPQNTGLLENQNRNLLNVNPAVKSIAAPIKNPIAPNTAPAQSVKATNVNPQSQLGIGRKNETIKTGTGKNIPTSKAIVQNAGQKVDVINKSIIRKKDTINKSKSQAAASLEAEARKFPTAEEFVKAQKETIIVHSEEKMGGKLEYKDGLLKYSIDENSGNLIIDSIEVKNKRQGIGSKLMDEVQNVAKAKGAKKIELNAFPKDDSISSKDLINFYEGKGYNVNETIDIMGDISADMSKNVSGGNQMSKTKSQLTDIWNKANKKTAKGGLPALGKTDDLFQEARKYKTAEEFVKAQFSKPPKYGMSHRPSWDGMPPAHNLLEGKALPRDVYTHPDLSIANGAIRRGEKAANESWQALQKIKGKPNAKIIVYRAGVKNELNIGDWITLSKEYAKQSIEGTEKVHSFKVIAKDIIFAGDDINEFGYYPKSQLTDIWNKANKKKRINLAPRNK